MQCKSCCVPLDKHAVAESRANSMSIDQWYCIALLHDSATHTAHQVAARYGADAAQLATCATHLYHCKVIVALKPSLWCSGFHSLQHKLLCFLQATQTPNDKQCLPLQAQCHVLVLSSFRYACQAQLIPGKKHEAKKGMCGRDAVTLIGHT